MNHLISYKEVTCVKVSEFLTSHSQEDISLKCGQMTGPLGPVYINFTTNYNLDCKKQGNCTQQMHHAEPICATVCYEKATESSDLNTNIPRNVVMFLCVPFISTPQIIAILLEYSIPDSD